MGESAYQIRPLIYAFDSLTSHFKVRPDVFVAGDMFLYYEKGEPTSVVAPDIFVVIGADNHLRDSYLLWNEPKGPDFVLEITSRSTRIRDQGTKHGLYQYLGVTEYFCFDPTFDYLKPPLCGHRLQDGRYEPIIPMIETPAHIVLESQTLGLSLQLLDGEFRFIDPQSGLVLVSYDESLVERAEESAARRQAEAGRAQAEVRIRELEAKLAALSGGNGKTSGS